MARESLESKQARAREILSRLRQEFPQAQTALLHRNSFELLIATILSAQCTDLRVNLVTPKLFAQAPTPEAMRLLGAPKIEGLIKSINFFRNKAKNIQATAEKLAQDFHSEVPRTLEELIQLPGVGRKTANVVLGSAFEVPGMVVDTHVGRLAKRLGLSRHFGAVPVEKDLEKVFDRKDWVDAAHLLILHGRKTCQARHPWCERCVLVDLCPSRFKAAGAWKKSP